jgi:flagellar protein FlbB
MKRRVSLSLVVGGTLCWLLLPGLSRSGTDTPAAGGRRELAPVAAGDKSQPPPVNSIEQARALETSRLQLLEKEAALHAKELELQRLAAGIDKQIKELESARKAMEGATAGKNKESGERAKRLLKIYKSLKPEEAAKLMNALEDDLTLAMLDQLDKKTVTKLIPLLNQPRVLEWTRENFPAED